MKSTQKYPKVLKSIQKYAKVLKSTPKTEKYPKALQSAKNYTKETNEGMILILVWVDDLIVGGKNETMLNETKRMMHERFKMKDLFKKKTRKIQFASYVSSLGICPTIVLPKRVNQ